MELLGEWGVRVDQLGHKSALHVRPREALRFRDARAGCSLFLRPDTCALLLSLPPAPRTPLLERTELKRDIFEVPMCVSGGGRENGWVE